MYFNKVKISGLDTTSLKVLTEKEKKALLTKIKNNDHFSYEGLYSDCFNHISFCYYVGFNVRFTRLKLEARIGSYLVPQFSPEKISYHNMTKTHVDGSYFEIRVYYRIFTTGKVHSSPYMFD